MSGDATNAHVWENADVYIDDTMAAAAPIDVTAPWDAAWSVAGLLDGEEGFTESRSEDTSERYAWGGLLVKRTKSKHKRTISFAMLEDNAVTFGLVNPGSTRTTGALTTSTIVVPKSQEFSIGFETSDGTTTRRRWVKRAEVDSVEDVKDSESDATVYKVTVILYPEADGTLIHELSGASA